jgi:hypothetical protein
VRVQADSVTAGAPWEAQSSPSTPNNGSGSASDAQTTEDASRSGADDSGGAAQAEGTEGDLDEIDEEQDNEEVSRAVSWALHAELLVCVRLRRGEIGHIVG